jgi:hypothetical protein
MLAPLISSHSDYAATCRGDTLAPLTLLRVFAPFRRNSPMRDIGICDRSWRRIRARARNSRLFAVAGMRPRSSAASLIDSPETKHRLDISRKGFGSLVSARARAAASSRDRVKCSGVGIGEVKIVEPAARSESSKLTQCILRLCSRRCIRQWFITMRVIHVLKVASSRKPSKCRKAERYAD